MKEIERKMKTVVKGISRKIFRTIALESSPTVHLGGRPMIVLKKKLSSNLPRRVVQYIYRNSVVCFQEQKAFVLKTVFFLAYWLRHV